MIELSAVEYNHTYESYIAILSDGSEFPLTSENLREAELEAQTIVDKMSFVGEYTRFRAVKDWE